MAFTEKYVTAAATGLGSGSSESDAWTLSQAHSNCAAGDRINVKAGTYTLTSGLYTSKSGTDASPIAWRGYKTTIGDRDNETTRQVSGTDIPKIVTNTSGGYFGFTGNYLQFSRIAFETNTYNRPALYFRTANSRAFHCQFLSTQAYARCIEIGYGQRQIVAYCEVELTYPTLAQVAMSGGNHHQFVGNTIKVASPDATCINSGNYYANVVNNLCIGGATGCAISSAGNQRLVTGNTFVGSTVGLSLSGGNAVIQNNLFANCTSGITASSSCESLIFSNAFYNVTTEYGSNVNPETGVFDSVTETSDPFVDAASNDYTLNSTALSVGSASPSKIRMFFTDNNADIGAVSAASGGGGSGGGSTVHPLYAN